MGADLSTQVVDGETVARVLLHGDLKQLTASQKVSYYRAVCESVGLNPLTQPFQYLVLNGREILYARREATEQLRQLHKVSIAIVGRELVEDIYVVTARATLPDGRTDENIGAVPLGGLKGEARANGMMKAETKSKRRVTLAICGLGLLDETEVESLPREALTYDPKPAPPAMALAVEDALPAAKAAEDQREQQARARELKRQYGVSPNDLMPAPDPAAPSLADLTEGFVFIERVDSSPTKNPKVIRFIITTSTGEQAATINSLKASLAEQYRDQRTPVIMTVKQTKFGADLVKLETAADRARQPELPPTEDEIPF